MAKLYFRYGAVGSAKTLNLLAVAHNYRMQDKRVILVKPLLDDRFGQSDISSRAGLSAKADVLIDGFYEFKVENLVGVHCLLVDEAQFLHPDFIDHLRSIADEFHIPVICYGLRTDFRRRTFPGSQRLLELADAIEEVKSTCHFCNKKAIYNLKSVDGVPTTKGPAIELGCEDKYLPACSICYNRQLSGCIAVMQSEERVH